MTARSKMTEERALLEERIVQFDERNDTKLAPCVMLASKAFNDLMKEHIPLHRDRKIKIRWIESDVCFRLELDLPVLLLFHMSTRHNKRMHGYFRPYHKFTVPSEFVPVYNCNLNHLTLLKTHTTANTWYWHRVNSDEESDFFCKKFVDAGGKKMIQSSLNFMLQNDSKPEDVSCAASETVEECFHYFYWWPEFPEAECSPIHDMIYNSASRINSYHRIYKTVARVVEVEDKRYSFEKNMYKINFSYGRILTCVVDRDGFRSMTRNVLLAEPYRSCVKDGDVINCIIDRPIFPKPTDLSRPIVAGLVGLPIPPGDLKPIIGLAIWNITQRIGSQQKPCSVGTVEDVRLAVFSILKSNPRMFPSEWVDGFEDCFQTSLNDMFPHVFKDEENVIHIPPPMMGYILSRLARVPDGMSDLADLSRLVDLAAGLGAAYRPAKLRFSEEGSKVQCGPYGRLWKSLIKDMPLIISEMHYSRVFAQPPLPCHL